MNDEYDPNAADLGVRIFPLVAGTGIAALVGGVSSYVFLEVLERATRAYLEHTWLLAGLPAVGVLWALVGRRLGDLGSTGMVIEQARRPDRKMPGPMALATLLGTWTTHLFGGSVGREGAAVQVSAGFADQVWARQPLRHGELAILRRGAVAAGFGAVFGVPIAGAVFALEAPRSLGPDDPAMSLFDIVVCGFASLGGHVVVIGLGHRHGTIETVLPNWSVTVVASVVGAGLLCGLLARLMVWGRAWLGSSMKRIGSPVARGALGGTAAAAVIAALGTQYGSLSLPLLGEAVTGREASWVPPLAKAVTTTVSVGVGFPGGEVTPLLVVGATAGAAMGAFFGVASGAIGAVSTTAAFGAASMTPIACSVMAAELVGWDALPFGLLACIAAALAMGPTSLYGRASPLGLHWRGERSMD